MKESMNALSRPAKRSRLRQLLLACGLLAGLLTFPSLARADATGYPCNILFYPGSTSLGTGGYVQFNLYSNVGCSGTYLGLFYLATTGSTIGFVSYNAEQIQTMSRDMTSAWAAGKQVTALETSTGQNGNVTVANFLYLFR
jgi:hypothetical protein